MPIVLNIETYDPALGENNLRRIEVASRLTIGRGADNDLVLPDPQRHLSKTHCIIAYDARGGTITDTSTNGVFLDDSPERLPRNVPMPLSEGNVLRFGGYQISVAAIAPSLPATASAARPAAVGRSPDSPDDGLFGDPLASSPAQQEPIPGTYSENAAGFQDFGQPRNAGSFSPVIPDDVDFFIDPEPAQSWDGPSQADHTPSDQVFFAPPKVASQRIPDDWDMSEFAPTAGGRSSGRPMPIDTPVAHPAQPAGAARIPAPVPEPNLGRASPSDSAAVAAFLAAIGLKEATLSDGEKLRIMQLAGGAFATMVKGLAEILAARASTKQEFRIERTTIGAMRNNPLKFSASTEEAIRVMLLERTSGFLSAKEAIDEALDDIKSHQLAVLAGMQVALATVIARFDPEKLENRLDQRSLIEGILPTARKARYWQLFKSLYKDIATELEEDFQKAFGAEFARAYRKRIGRP